MPRLVANYITKLINDHNDALESTLRSNYLDLCSRFEAPIPAGDLLSVITKPEIQAGVGDAYGRVRSFKITSKAKLIHKSEEGLYVDNGKYEQFPNYPLDEVKLTRHYTARDMLFHE